MPQNELKQEEIEESSRLVRFIERGDPTITAMLRQKMEQETEGSALAAAVHQELQRDKVEELRAALVKEGRKRIVRRNWLIGGFLTYVGVLGTLSILTHDTHILSGIGSMTGILAAAAAATRGQKKLTKALVQYRDDARVAGPLAEALEFKDRRLLPIVSDVLIQLLPQLKASDRDRLNAEQRACLYRALCGRNPQLTLAILKSLQQIGDGKALPYVQKLKEDKRALRRDALISKEIEVCLPFLTDLAEQEKNSQTLLRAADGNLTPPDVLLRPAAGPSHTNPDELLRPTLSDDTVI